jgi:hypothetical protein
MLKANHERAFEAVREHFGCTCFGRGSSGRPVFDAFDESHGRLVGWRVFASPAARELEPLRDWPDLRTVLAVETIRSVNGTGKTEAEIRYFLTSCEDDPVFLAQAIRRHWSIENALHWSQRCQGRLALLIFSRLEGVGDRLEMAEPPLVDGPVADGVATVPGLGHPKRRLHIQERHAPVAAQLVAIWPTVRSAGSTRQLAKAREHGEQSVHHCLDGWPCQRAALARGAQGRGNAAHVDRDLLAQPQLRDLPGQRLLGLVKRPKGQLGKRNRAARPDDHPLAALASLDAGLADQGVAVRHEQTTAELGGSDRPGSE